MKTRKDYERAIASVAKVIRGWDPYALVRGGAAEDEFDAEIARLVRQVPNFHTPEDAARAVSSVFSEAFGPDGFDLESCREVGRLLFERLERSGLIAPAVWLAAATDASRATAARRRWAAWSLCRHDDGNLLAMKGRKIQRWDWPPLIGVLAGVAPVLICPPLVIWHGLEGSRGPLRVAAALGGLLVVVGLTALVARSTRRREPGPQWRDTSISRREKVLLLTYCVSRVSLAVAIIGAAWTWGARWPTIPLIVAFVALPVQFVMGLKNVRNPGADVAA
jgi:Domain of unknown function (DUF1871)